MPTFTNLTSGGGSAATSFTTASVSPAANRLLLLTVHGYLSAGSTAPSQPTISGNGLTWVLVRTQNVDTSGSDRGTMFVFRAMGAAPTAGVITINWGATSTKAAWVLDQSSADVVTTGTDGSGAIINTSGATAGASGTTATVAVSPAMSAPNTAYAVVCTQTNAEGKTPRAGWTEIVDYIATTFVSVQSQYLDGQDTTASATWTTSARWGIVFIEVGAGAGVDATFTTTVGDATASGGTVALLAGGDASFSTTTGTAIADGGTVSLVATLPLVADYPEPESHARNPVMVDGNGNLYKVLETPVALDNRPAMFKSTDGGATWTEMDSANRPNSSDLEGTWVLQSTGVLHFVTTPGPEILWYIPFRTSDAASNQDTWGALETALTGTSESGIEQYSSVTRNSDGTMWMFYSDNLSGANNQIGHVKRTAANTYSAVANTVGGNTAIDWTGPASVMGAGDVTHVIYKDSTNHIIYRRTLTASGTLSGAQQVATGVSADHLAHAAPIYYDDNGVEVIGVLYANNLFDLKYREIRDGVVGAEEDVADAPVLSNPAAVTNGGTVASLAVRAKTVYAIWTDSGTGNILYAVRDPSTGWGNPIQAWVAGSATSYYAYGTLYVRAAQLWLGISFDRGTHANDEGHSQFLALQLGSVVDATFTTAVGTATADGSTVTLTGTTGGGSPAALVSTSRSGLSDSLGTSNTCPVPAGAAAGMTAFLAIEINIDPSNTAITPTWPSGFVQMVDRQATPSGGVQLLVAKKTLTGGDTGNYVTTLSASRWNQSMCALVSNATTISTPDVNSLKDGSGTAISSLSLTVAAAPVLIHFQANSSSATHTPPTNFTEQQEGDYLTVATYVPGTTGAQSTSGATQSASTPWAAVLIAAEGGGSGGTDATFTTSAGTATADGTTVTLRGDATLTTVVGIANADGSTVNLTGGATLTTAVGTGTSDGGTVTLSGTATFPTVVGDATADGGTVTLSGTSGSTFLTTTGDAVADGSVVTLRGDATFSTTAGTATADGSTVTLRGGTTFGTTVGTATSDGGTATLTGGASLSATVGAATADGGTAALTGGASFGTTVGTASADGSTLGMAGTAMFSTATGEAVADGGTVTLTAFEPGDSAVGEDPITAIKAGTNPVSKIFLGVEQLWP